MKEKRQLTRKEVIKMLGLLPTNYTDVLEAELNLLMIIAEEHQSVDLGKFTEHFDTVSREWNEKDTDAFFKAKKFMVKNGVWQLVQECLDELADCGCLY